MRKTPQGNKMSSKKKKHESKKLEEQETRIKELETRVKELEESFIEANNKSEKYLNQLKYVKADLENIQKQNQRRMEDIIEKANGELLQQLLPLLDELEILYTNDNAEKAMLLKGIEMVHKKLQKLMESEGIQPILALGHSFDPFRHEAILEVETTEEPDGYVLDEVRRGYMFKDRVLRASVVKVAKSPKDEEKEEIKDE